MTRQELIESLERLRKNVCVYLGSTCDCKYGGPPPLATHQKAIMGMAPHIIGEQTGCPELRSAIAFFTELSDQEWNDVWNRLY